MRLNSSEFVSRLRGHAVLSLDTETTGLRPFHGDRPFAIVAATAREACYYELSGNGDLAGDEIREYFRQTPLSLFLHNAKFDLHHLAQVGVEIHPESQILDTMVLARLVKSDLPSLSLDACAQHFLGEAKDDKVMAYIEEHGLWAWEDVPDLSHQFKRMFFDKVPREILQPYAELDAVLTLRLGLHLTDRLRDIDRTSPQSWPKIAAVVETEAAITRICYDMEKGGVRLDEDYCRKALEHAKEEFRIAGEKFTEITGRDYKASGKLFEEVLPWQKETHPRTDKGNLSFTGEALEQVPGEAAGAVLDCKNHKARINVYAGLLWERDADRVVHTNFRQAGTRTGRFSSANPNLQNLARPEDGAEAEAFPVRRAIVPDSPEHALVMFDYQAMEYRLMLDYAAEMPLIGRVLAGEDLHQATANLVGLTRTRAKTLNFAILYGAGQARLAEMLMISVDEAKRLKYDYLDGLPSVRRFIGTVRDTASRRGLVYTWAGRRLLFTDRSKAYAATNHLIQGGCADIAKRAMVRVHDIMRGSRSRLSLQVHDEFVVNLHDADHGLIPAIEDAMVSVYRANYLPMAVSVAHSYRSLADKISGPPVRR